MINITHRRVVKEDCFYDIISDIHGYANALDKLLSELNYTKIDGVWRHKSRKAVFLGDYVDRGPDSRGVISIVKSMVEAGYAHAVLGNHDLSLILYLTKNPETGKAFKKPSESNRKNFEVLKQEFEGESELLKDYVRWLRKLPFYIDFTNFRVAHAYWSSEYIQIIDEHRKEGKLSKSLLALLSDPDAPFTTAVGAISRGLEMKLPDDLILKDSKNIRRKCFRIGYWEDPKDKTFHELSYGNKFELPKYTVPKEFLFPFEIYDKTKPLLFIGHYCIGRKHFVATDNICCVDACVAYENKLAAYRWKGEKTVEPSNFVLIDR